jgi:hypothetical protein
MATMAKQKIDFASLPDSQHVITGQGTIKTVGQIKKEWQSVRVAAEAKAKSVAAKTLKDFELYRQKFQRTQMQVRQNLAIENAKLIAKVKGAAPSAGNNPPQVSAAGSVTTPVITAIDRDHGMFGEAVLITGKDFQSSPATVKFMVSADTWKDGGISYWSDTQIIATVPDNTGNPDYDGFLLVEKAFGKKSQPTRFRITSEQDLILLSGTGANVVLNGADVYGNVPGTFYGPCMDHNWVGSASDIVVYHEPKCGGNMQGNDFLWKDFILKNGWIVDNVVLTKISGLENDYAQVTHSVLGTTTPALEVAWRVDNESLHEAWSGIDYETQVYIRGPKGVPYK